MEILKRYNNFLKKITISFSLFFINFININQKFFFENHRKLNYCHNYGLFVYDYHYLLNKPFPFVNLGDYIQSLAALQYLPKNCMPILIERDTFQYYYGPKIKLIVNGWFRIQEGNKFTSEHIMPLYLSYHINNNCDDQRLIEQLKKFQPIGCRDINTYNLLIKKGIKSYFSSCLTTTLDINYYKGENLRTEEIIFTDFKFGSFPKIDNFIKSLKEYNYNNITYLTHFYRINISHLERFRIANNHLKKYARAKLVITTRIHAALPCLSLKTPVILVNKKYDKKRFGGLYTLLNTIGMNSKNKFEINVNINERGLVFNSDKYLYYSNKLKNYIKKNF